MDPRRKVGYKEMRADAAKKASLHGPERSLTAFLEFGEECAGICEMDTDTGDRARPQHAVRPRALPEAPPFPSEIGRAFV